MSLLSWIQGEIGLKIYYVDAVPAPPVAPPEKDPPVPEEAKPDEKAEALSRNAVPEGEKKPQPDSSAPPPPQQEQPPEAKDQEPPQNTQEQDPPQPVKEQGSAGNLLVQISLHLIKAYSSFRS
ncbi:hypothetical protein Pint_20086 [Pistacia integerrima]|uniref:Uncharacterized protein n=1 Tax=Pistacia integerrima TaxID=434235 RepID=A0ACC0X8N1_9ROSI|nr:hypothetical protein Pint_20086 [Pistacia integerrima]